MVMFYETTYVQQENIRALLTIPPSSQKSGAIFLFFTDSLIFFEVTKSQRVDPEKTLETI